MKGKNMLQQQSRLGAITALFGGVLALFALFALPLFSILGFNITALQFANLSENLSQASSLYNSSSLFNSSSPFSSGNSYTNGTSNAVIIFWFALIIPLIGIILSAVVVGRGSSLRYYPSHPMTSYSPPSGLVYQSTGGKLLANAIVGCATINILIVVAVYINANSVSSMGITLASFFGAGFWLYAMSVAGMLVGGFIQMFSVY
jgi:hypothetical protein